MVVCPWKFIHFVQRILKEDKAMKRILAASVVALCLHMPLACGAAEASFTPGTYVGKSSSVGGPITVSVTVDETTIQSVEVTEIHDTSIVSDEAVIRIPEQIVEYQTTNVDTVSGATLSSIFIRNAVNDALKQAGTASTEKAPAYMAPAQEDTEADVVVVGAGISGISAALAAADQGADVILLEKLAYIGGFFNVSDQGVVANGAGPFAAHAEATAEQLNSLGMNIEVTSMDYPGYGTLHTLSVPENPEVNFSTYYVKKAWEIAEEKGIRILTETPATGLLVEDGKVIGVTAQPKGQEVFEIRADKVILTTGGFNSNAELVSRYLPFADGARAVTLGATMGEALEWVAPLDAKLVLMEASDASFYTVSPSTGYYTEMGTAVSHFVNLDGTLITDDTTYNQGAQKVYMAIGGEQFYNLTTVAGVEAAGSGPEYEHMLLAGSVEKYDSIDAINEALDTPELAATAEAIGLEEGPYYIGKSIAGIYGTYGGIATDGEGRVLNSKDEVIEGLYAAGEVMGSRDYQALGFYSGGLGAGMISGNLAGNAAVADAAE